MPLWVDDSVMYRWGPATQQVIYFPRVPRQHLEPIEDEL